MARRCGFERRRSPIIIPVLVWSYRSKKLGHDSNWVYSLPAEHKPAGYRYNLLGECRWIDHSDARATLTQSVSSFRRETECGEDMEDNPAVLHARPFHCPTQVTAHSYLFT